MSFPQWEYEVNSARRREISSWNLLSPPAVLSYLGIIVIGVVTLVIGLNG